MNAHHLADIINDGIGIHADVAPSHEQRAAAIKALRALVASAEDSHAEGAAAERAAILAYLDKRYVQVVIDLTRAQGDQLHTLHLRATELDALRRLIGMGDHAKAAP